MNSMRFFDWLMVGINALTVAFCLSLLHINRNLSERLNMLRNFMLSVMGPLGYESIQKYFQSIQTPKDEVRDKTP